MMWSLLGVLILFNILVWPQWSGIDGWMAFAGIILIFAGVFKSLIPGCNCKKDSECKTEPMVESKEAVISSELPKMQAESKVHKKKK